MSPVGRESRNFTIPDTTRPGATRDAGYAPQLQAALQAARPALRVDFGEALMVQLAKWHDPWKAMRGLDNFLVFAAELEVYRRAARSLHVCTACPRGAADACASTVRRLRDAPAPRATGLMREWVYGGTG